MLIDPFTIVAQLINFGILLIVLKVLLFDRVVRVMDQRQSEVTARLREADERRQEADDRAVELEERLGELERTRSELMADARGEARRHRDELVARSREEMDQQRREWHLAMEEEHERLIEQLRRDVGEQVVGIAAEVLRDLADRELEGQLVVAFIARLDALGEEEREELRTWLGAAGDRPATISSAFPVSDELRVRIADWLAQLADRAVPLRYEPDPGLLCGIELRVGGRVVGWTVDGYLARLAGEIRARLAPDEGDRPEDPERGPSPDRGRARRDSAGASTLPGGGDDG